MIPYDYINIPLLLIRRIVDWHEEFGAALYEGVTDEWEEKHGREKREIALELQRTLGSGIDVQVMTAHGWTSIVSEAV